MVDGYIALGVTLFSLMAAPEPDAGQPYQKGKAAPAAQLQAVLAPVEILIKFKPPGKPSVVAPLAKRHGIALFGARSHHMDLVMAMAEGEFESNPMGKRILAELQIRPGEWTKRGEAQMKAEAKSGAANPPKDDKKKEEDDPAKRMDDAEELLLSGLREVFSAKEAARFEELGCQMAGPMALRLNHYAARMQLSAAQQKRIRALVDAYEEKSAPLQRASFVNWSADADKKLQALACELDRKILAALTDKQRAKWPTFLGKKFDWTGITD
jgi:hypothetical protein